MSADGGRRRLNLRVELTSPNQCHQLLNAFTHIVDGLTDDHGLAVGNGQRLLGITDFEIELAALVRPEPHPRRPPTRDVAIHLFRLFDQPIDQPLQFVSDGVRFRSFHRVDEGEIQFLIHPGRPVCTLDPVPLL